jgi:hypothetical protein
MRLALIIGGILICPALAVAQNPVCSLTTFWVRQSPFVSSSRWLIGTFPAGLSHDEKPLRKTFHHDESDTDVSVGVESMKASPDPKDSTTILRIAFVFSNKPFDIFENSDGVYAESIYDKHWRMVSVSRSIPRGDRIYTFTLGCERLPERKRSR